MAYAERIHPPLSRNMLPEELNRIRPALSRDSQPDMRESVMPALSVRLPRRCPAIVVRIRRKDMSPSVSRAPPPLFRKYSAL